MRLILAAIITLAACSHNALDPGAGSDPGTGTGTLSVMGGATASPNIPNSNIDTDFETNFHIVLQLGGQPLTTGTVTVRARSGTAMLTYDNNGEWRGQAVSYDEVYELNVVSGPDEIRN